MFTTGQLPYQSITVPSALFQAVYVSKHAKVGHTTIHSWYMYIYNFY